MIQTLEHVFLHLDMIIVSASPAHKEIIFIFILRFLHNNPFNFLIFLSQNTPFLKQHISQSLPIEIHKLPSNTFSLSPRLAQLLQHTKHFYFNSVLLLIIKEFLFLFVRETHTEIIICPCLKHSRSH